MAELTIIPVSKATRDKLKMFGAKGDTYNEILTRLIKMAEYEEKFVPLEEL